MKIKHFFSVALLLLIGSFLGHAQSEGRKFDGDENYLRMCIQWDDSTEYQTPSYPKVSGQAVYKFKCRSLFWGIYKEFEIYVATSKQALNKFNQLRRLGADYFWTLRKTESTIDGLPVYYHSGNF